MPNSTQNKEYEKVNKKKQLEIHYKKKDNTFQQFSKYLTRLLEFWIWKSRPMKQTLMHYKWNPSANDMRQWPWTGVVFDTPSRYVHEYRSRYHESMKYYALPCCAIYLLANFIHIIFLSFDQFSVYLFIGWHFQQPFHCCLLIWRERHQLVRLPTICTQLRGHFNF